ncbi:MAG: hypothetical protein JWN72_2770, partial [Thermoleophilia bacterium]|nr:hypothetical protein [Thermoleophilia bacterium]
MTFSQQQHTPLPDEQFAATSGGLPALALPPVPFARAAAPFAAPAPIAAPVEIAAPVGIAAPVAAPAPTDAPVSAGSAVDAMLAQLTSGLDMSTPQPQIAQYTPAPTAAPTPAPTAAPTPAPTAAPEEFDFHGLQPARRYEAPNRAPLATTVLSTRPNIAQTTVHTPHPLGEPTHVAPPAPAARQEFVSHQMVVAAPAPDLTPAAGFAPTSEELDSVYATIVGNAGVGRLDPFPGQAPLTAPQTHPSAPHAGPAAPHPAPGFGLAPAVAVAAAAPSAWFGGHVQADDQLLVWNSQGSAAALSAGLAAPHAGLAAHVAAGLPVAAST